MKLELKKIVQSRCIYDYMRNLPFPYNYEAAFDFLDQADIAYLRWIYINKDICGNGIGSECMSALKNDLYNKGIVEFDTDTALINSAAQHFYEKNYFVKEGVTRSYFLEPPK